MKIEAARDCEVEREMKRKKVCGHNDMVFHDAYVKAAVAILPPLIRAEAERWSILFAMRQPSNFFVSFSHSEWEKINL